MRVPGKLVDHLAPVDRPMGDWALATARTERRAKHVVVRLAVRIWFNRDRR